MRATFFGHVWEDLLRDHARQVVIDAKPRCYQVAIEGDDQALLSMMVAPQSFFRTRRAALERARAYAAELAADVGLQVEDRTLRVVGGAESGARQRASACHR